MSPLTAPLDAQQLAAYERDGYIVLPAAISEDEVADLAAEADRVLDLVLRSSLRAGERNPRLDAAFRDGRLKVRKIQPLNDLSALLDEISRDPRLIDPMRQLMGDDPVLMEEKLNYKLDMGPQPAFASLDFGGRADDGFDLHTDWGYYRYHGYPDATISSAITIDDCVGRGPLRVIPGTHRRDYEYAHLGDGRLGPDDAGTFTASDRVALEVPPGSVLLFHSKLVHDSIPNPTSLPRKMLIYSHYPASHGGDPDRRNRWLREKAQPMESAVT